MSGNLLLGLQYIIYHISDSFNTLNQLGLALDDVAAFDLGDLSSLDRWVA